MILIHIVAVKYFVQNVLIIIDKKINNNEYRINDYYNADNAVL